MKRTILICVSILLAAAGARAADTKELYDKHCAKCHGAEGKGETKMGQKLGVKDLTSAKVQADLKDEAAIKAIKEGVKEGDKIRMKAIEGLTDSEIQALVAYVRKFKK